MSGKPEVGLVIDDRTRVLAVTGAGVSAESGLPTCGELAGQWADRPLDWLASRAAFTEDAEFSWTFYSRRRRQALDCRVNPAHEALAYLEGVLGPRFLLVTQNVDGLHARAGSRRLVELHGSLLRSRCAHCERPAFPDEQEWGGERVPLCDVCEREGRMGLLRPDVVWFGEAVSPASHLEIEAFIDGAGAAGERLVLLVAGTSGRVTTASRVVDQARNAGAETWLFDLAPAPALGTFDHARYGPCAAALSDAVASAVARFRDFRSHAAGLTGEAVLCVGDGSSRSATVVSSVPECVEMLTTALNGVEDWADIKVTWGGEMVGGCVAVYFRDVPTCHVEVRRSLPSALVRQSRSMIPGELLHAASWAGGELTLQAGRMFRTLPYEELDEPGFLFECHFPPSAPPVHAVVFDEAGLLVGFLDYAEPGGLAIVLPVDYDKEPDVHVPSESAAG
jgi:NAD-dependent protein deacetylase/lipoamidase